MGNDLNIGDRAPNFELPSQHGTPTSLEALLQKGPVVVFFYPKDETAVCTAEACAFRDSFEAFTAAGASVVGISSDSVQSHLRFATRHTLPFLLLADAAGEVRKLYGVPRTLGILPGRVTYVIDRQGKVRHKFNAQLAAAKHMQEALQHVQALH
jgi:peroxiredoxin Q/BCP